MPPSLDSIATIKAKIGTEIRALETERDTLEQRLAAVCQEITVRIAVRAAVGLPDFEIIGPTLTIPRRIAK
jgi:hypothetical protein